jgi:F-type H+-transporting ATPase subunit epsilon
MADTVKFELVSPERLLFSADVESVVVPGTEGDFGVLEGHAPVMSTIRDGAIQVYRTEGAQPENIEVRGGFAEVGPNGLTVLAERVEG